VGSLRRRFGVLLCAFIVTPALAAGHFDGHSWWTIVTALADDANAGRDTGSPGEQQAEAYIVEHLQQLGVSPGSRATTSRWLCARARWMRAPPA
jgi:hypothetical protein